MDMQFQKSVVESFSSNSRSAWTRGRGLLLALGFAMLATTYSPLGSAQTAPATTAPATTAPTMDRASLMLLFSACVEAANKGEWQQSYNLCLQAWDQKKHYQIAANLARAELHLDKYKDAAEHLTYFLREAKEVDPTDRELVYKMLHEAKDKVATLKIVVNREGAEVLVDNVVVGVSPLSSDIFVEPGRRVLEARVPGQGVQKVPLDLKAGQKRQVGLRFGVDVEQPPPVVVEQQPATGGPNKTLLIAGSATAGALLVNGIVFAGLASVVPQDNNPLSCYEDQRPVDTKCSQVETDKRNKGIAFTNIAIMSFVGAGAVGAATVLYGLFGPREEETPKPKTRVVPVATHQGGGLWVTGRW